MKDMENSHIRKKNIPRNFNSRNYSLKVGNKYFTLLELLIVIAILVILLALLLPAIRKVKETSTAINCIMNLKQAGLCVVNYASDNKEWGPFPLFNGVCWANLLKEQNYLAGNNAVMKCPTNKTIEVSSGFYGMRTMNQDSTLSAIRISSGRPKSNGNAEWNSPSELIYIGDTLYSSLETGAVSGVFKQHYSLNDNNYANAAKALPHMRHNNKVNILFGDAHANSISSSLLGDSVRPHSGWTWIRDNGALEGRYP